MKEPTFQPGPLAEAPRPLEHREMHNGLPVLGVEEFERLYNTDVRSMGEHGAATFNFRGYIRDTRPGGDGKLYYRDVLATNGLLKSEDHPGIHVGTDGTDYNRGAYAVESPEDVTEYDVYISIPCRLQKEKGVFCRNDYCRSVDEFDGDAEELEELYQNEPQFLVMRLMGDAQSDPLARSKAQLIHLAIVRHIETGKPLQDIEDMVRDLERRLEDVKTPEDVRRLLPQFSQAA